MQGPARTNNLPATNAVLLPAATSAALAATPAQPAQRPSSLPNTPVADMHVTASVTDAATDAAIDSRTASEAADSMYTPVLAVAAAAQSARQSEGSHSARLKLAGPTARLAGLLNHGSPIRPSLLLQLLHPAGATDNTPQRPARASAGAHESRRHSGKRPTQQNSLSPRVDPRNTGSSALGRNSSGDGDGDGCSDDDSESNSSAEVNCHEVPPKDGKGGNGRTPVCTRLSTASVDAERFTQDVVLRELVAALTRPGALHRQPAATGTAAGTAAVFPGVLPTSQPPQSGRPPLFAWGPKESASGPAVAEVPQPVIDACMSLDERQGQTPECLLGQYVRHSNAVAPVAATSWQLPPNGAVQGGLQVLVHTVTLLPAASFTPERGSLFCCIRAAGPSCAAVVECKLPSSDGCKMPSCSGGDGGAPAGTAADSALCFAGGTCPLQRYAGVPLPSSVAIEVWQNRQQLQQQQARALEGSGSSELVGLAAVPVQHTASGPVLAAGAFPLRDVLRAQTVGSVQLTVRVWPSQPHFSGENSPALIAGRQPDYRAYRESSFRHDGSISTPAVATRTMDHHRLSHAPTVHPEATTEINAPPVHTSQLGCGSLPPLGQLRRTPDVTAFTKSGTLGRPDGVRSIQQQQQSQQQYRSATAGSSTSSQAGGSLALRTSVRGNPAASTAPVVAERPTGMSGQRGAELTVHSASGLQPGTTDVSSTTERGRQALGVATLYAHVIDACQA